jgi:hypothetical protein
MFLFFQLIIVYSDTPVTLIICSCNRSNVAIYCYSILYKASLSLFLCSFFCIVKCVVVAASCVFNCFRVDIDLFTDYLFILCLSAY